MLKVGGLSVSKIQNSPVYVTVLFRGNKKRTGLSEEDLTVRWNDRLDFKLKGNPLDAKSSLQIHLKENGKSEKGRLVGSTVVRLGGLVGEKNKILSFNQIPLLDKNKQKTKNTISFDIIYEAPTTGKKQKEDGTPQQPPSVTNISGIPDPAARPPPLPQEQDTGRGTSKFSKNISSKSQDFQVRIRIIEGRHLQGVNIKPFVKVYVGDSSFRTRIRHGNNPVFDEIFFQNFHKTPSEVFNTSIHIQVLNSHSLRSDSMIGIFKLDIGGVYEFPDHAVLRKWLLLYEVDDVHSMAKGYLKVSIIILAAGDEAPLDKKGTNEEDDVESNLLQPTGVLSRWVTFIVKVYKAEDISHTTKGLTTNLKRMFGVDTEWKDGADSFLEVSFAGNKVATKVVENQINPEWNQVIYLRSRFPSLSDNIWFTVYDRKSAIKKTPLGTTKLNISLISAMGLEDEDTGFLPHFGPCFLNLYGSPREGLDGADKDDELNLGKVEGVYYRGRILIELITTMADRSGNNIVDLPSEDSLIVQKYLHRRRYSLCVVFYSATQLQESKEPIQFEVSMGNYGNRVDKSCKLHASTTQHYQPVFDGNYYYYLFWCDTKPVAALPSFWENIDHRLDRLNVLLKIIDRLKINLEDVKTALSGGGTHLTGAWIKMLDRVVKDCNRSLPSVKKLPHVTLLDQYLYGQQILILKKIRKSAEKLNDKNINIQDKLPEIEDWIERLTSVAEEPQISLPDIIIWMLSGEKRVAYARIKSHLVLFSSSDKKSCGKFCGKLQTVFMKYHHDKIHEMRYAAHLRLWIWLGLSSDEEEFEKLIDGKFMVAAERYENQAKVMGQWGTSGLLQHPMYSDAMGKMRLSKKAFHPLKGWQWDGKWTIDPEHCLLFDSDAGHTEFIDDVYENETHLAGGDWSPAFELFTDEKGNRHLSIDEIECPEGWEWKEEWDIDFSRAVDEDGWEYGSVIPPDKMPKTWNPTEKAYHTHRRRRWIRKRALKIIFRPVKKEDFDPDGWEYAPLFGWKFHVKPNKGDIYRRRRWRRKMVPMDQVGPATIFRLEGSLCHEPLNVEEDEFVVREKPNEKNNLYGSTAPYVTCLLDPPMAFQLRGYIYQARGLLPMDRSSLADPYIQMSFLYQSRKTDVIKGTVNPTWDQTLIVEDIEIYGNIRDIAENPPCIMLEMFDSNHMNKHEYMGGTLCYPTVTLDSSSQYVPMLRWYPAYKGARFSGELLLSCELFLKQKDEDQDVPPRPPLKDSDTYMVPYGIRPQLQLTMIEVLAWGLRNLKNYNMLRVTTPSLVVECSGEMIQTPPIKNYRKNPNFPSSIFFITVFLPIDPFFSPPIVIKVMDYRPFGYRPVVGQSMVKSLNDFFCDPFAGSANSEDPTVTATASFHVETPNIESSETEEANLDQEAPEGELEDDAIDWWCKFYASSGEHNEYLDYLQQGYDILKVYPFALEDVPQFQGLQDFCNTFKLYRVKGNGDTEDPFIVGEFKGSFRIYPLPEDLLKPQPPPQFRQLPSSEPQVCLVRVYIVRGLSLQPKDRNGMCDSYIKISIGKVLIDDREHYVPNTINPVFGRMFQLYATIPLNKDLKVEVYDYDMITQDDKIGETVIDLENRFLSHYGAHCGLPRTYCISGPTQWRDQLKPTELLNNLSKLKNYELPVINSTGRKVNIGEKEFMLEDFEVKKVPYTSLGPPQERLALHILRLQNLVPEHVETRTLFSSAQPGIEQGKLQMWIDIFPKDLGPPGPAFNITPRAPMRYVLRCIVWNTNDVILEETSIMGEKMSDIYVKGWMAGLEDNTQKTDVHYRSLDGEGNFNWRFIFPFEYIKVERVLVISKKNFIWNLDEMEVKIPPKLIIQLWDNDKFSFDDYLGYLELNLNALRSPTKWADHCTLNRFFKKEGSSSRNLQKLVSLFKQKRVKGWWPCISYKEGKQVLTGKVELTLELLTEFEAEERPAGKGREEPNMNPKLDPPLRPDTSFLWFRSPMKGLKHIVWRKYKWWVICALLLAVPIIFLVTLLNAIPNALANFLLQSTRFHGKKK